MTSFGRILVCTAIAIAGFTVPQDGHAADAIGRVRTLLAPATIEHAGQVAPATMGMPVYLGDVVRTGLAGAMGLVFVDDTTLSAGANSEIFLDEYVFDPGLKKASFLARITQGSFLFASGRINKIVPDSMAVQTNVATIGIRGTRFAVTVPPPAPQALPAPAPTQGKGGVQ